MSTRDHSLDASPEETLKSFEAAHQTRLSTLGKRAEDLESAAEAEREALYRHAQAIRTRAASLAKPGR